MKSKVFYTNRYIDTKKGKVVELDTAILTEDEIIVAIDTKDAISSHPNYNNAEKITLKGTVLPGLVDSHVHLIGLGTGIAGDDLVKLDDNLLAINGAQNARKHLDSGVTTIRDCGAKNQTTYMINRS